MITIVHWTGCDTSSTPTTCCTKESASSTACDATTCKVQVPTITGPSQTTDLGAVTVALFNADGTTNNVIGSSDGYVEFTMTTGSYWPLYGGKIIVDLPFWYGENSVSVFNADTACTADNVIIGGESTDTVTSSSTMILLYYTEAPTITLKCTLYNNPIYRKVVTGF